MVSSSTDRQGRGSSSAAGRDRQTSYTFHLSIILNQNGRDRIHLPVFAPSVYALSSLASGESRIGRLLSSYGGNRAETIDSYADDSVAAVRILAEPLLAMLSRFVQLKRNREAARKEGLRKKLRANRPYAFQKDSLPKDCCVCLSEFQERDRIRKLSCGHEFHMKCVDQWLIRGDFKCPVCRKAPYEKGLVEEQPK